MSETVTMWFPRYQIKRGVDEWTGKELTPGKFTKDGDFFTRTVGVEVFRTKDEALAKAEQERLDRVASLRSSLAKLERLCHTPSEPAA